MKKVFILAILLTYALSAMAQDTLDYSTSRYMVSRLCRTQWRTNPSTGYYFNSLFRGPIYSTEVPIQVYGVAVLTDDPYPQARTIDGLNVKIAQKEGGTWTVVDSAWWRGEGIDKHFCTTIHPCDSTLPDTHHVFPVCEVYFSHPINVFDTFAVGIGRYRPAEGAPWGISGQIGCISLCNPIEFENLEPDFLGHLWWVDAPGEYFGNSGEPLVFPILVPPDTDNYVCAGVDSVRVQGSGTGWVNVAWAPGCDDQDLFQIAYGVRGEDPDHYASLTNQESPRVIFDNTIDTGVYYSVRVRGRCHHRCAVHDTLMWGPWSDLVHFYVGNHEPGTGIAAPETATAFTLNPNPTNGEVTVVLPVLGEGAMLTVADATGREVRRQTLPPATEASRLRLDLKGLPAGAYFVTLVTPQGSHTEKLVISDQ